MAITSSDSYLNAAKQTINYSKIAAITTSAGSLRYTVFAAAGSFVPAGTLAGTANPGALFTPATTGFPAINFSTGSGYISRIQYSNSVTGRIELWDKIYGLAISPLTTAVPFTITPTSPPSITGRLINGNDYSSLRLFVEITTTMSATATTVQVTYTDAGGSSRSATATSSLSGFTAGRWVEIPLVTGGIGIQKIESVTIAGATNTNGAINVIIARLLWSSPRINIAPGGDVHGIDKTGMPQIFPTSALVATVVPEGTSTGLVDLAIEVANA